MQGTTMRGEVLQISDITGEGLVSGDDGRRYRFSAPDLITGPPSWGSRVDFVPQGDAATLLVVLQTAAFLENLPPPAPRLTPLGHFKRCCTTAYLQGEGRAGLTEFWSFTLIQMGIVLAVWLPLTLFVFTIVLTGMAAVAAGEDAGPMVAALPGIGVLAMIPLVLLSLYFVAPSICAKIRRLHDTGKSGLWVLLIFVPFGSLALFIMALMPTQPGANRFGHPPL